MCPLGALFRHSDLGWSNLGPRVDERRWGRWETRGNFLLKLLVLGRSPLHETRIFPMEVHGEI